MVITGTTTIIAGVAVLAGLILGPKAGEEIDKVVKDVEKNINKDIGKGGVLDTLTSGAITLDDSKSTPPITPDLPNEEEKTETAPTPQEPEKDKFLPGIPYQGNQEILDKTSENIESKIENSLDYEKIFAWQEEQQKKLWAREDEIRKETQAREDSAYQRAVADMRKAGINPNLINVQPAESGGGITQATGMNMDLFKTEISKYLGILETELNNSFKGEENTKDRITDTFTTILQLFSVYMMFQGKKGA